MFGNVVDRDGVPRRVTIEMPITAEALADMGIGFVKHYAEQRLAAYVAQEFGADSRMDSVELVLQDNRLGPRLVPVPHTP
jgi:hypothetical protein